MLVASAKGHSMKHAALVWSLLLTSLCFPAQAAERYPTVPVRIANEVEPPGHLEKLLSELRQAARQKDLSRVLANVGKTFFWARDHGGGFRPAASARTNFATALSLDPKQIKPEYRAQQWLAFTSLLNAGTASSPKDKPGVICLPGKAKPVDQTAATKIAEKFGTDPWFGMMLAAGAPVAVRKEPSRSSKIVGTVKNEAFFVRQKLRTDPDAKWEPVHLSTGAEGWVAKDQVHTFLDAQLCFGKAATGTWQIVGYNGGGD
jgi:hypothetical protein